MTNRENRVSMSYRTLARKLMSESDLGDALDTAKLDELDQLGVLREYPTGQALLIGNEPVTDVLFIVSGSLEISIMGADGRRAICWYQGPGQWFNVIPVIDDGPAIHNATTHGATCLVHVAKADFRRLLDKDTALSLSCLRMLCHRSRMLYERLAWEGLFSLRERLVRLMFMLLTQHGESTPVGVAMRVPLTQSQLADMLGITRQSLNRELKALTDAGLVTISRGHFAVPDMHALRAELDSPPISLISPSHQR
jgi:CRP/FNR family transcriptional regulator, cyclic AMP receptor protein